MCVSAKFRESSIRSTNAIKVICLLRGKAAPAERCGVRVVFGGRPRRFGVEREREDGGRAVEGEGERVSEEEEEEEEEVVVVVIEEGAEEEGAMIERVSTVFVEGDDGVGVLTG